MPPEWASCPDSKHILILPDLSQHLPSSALGLSHVSEDFSPSHGLWCRYPSPEICPGPTLHPAQPPASGEGGGNNAEGRGWGQQGLGNCQVHGGSGGPSFSLLTLSCGHRRKHDIPSYDSSLAEFCPPSFRGPLWSRALPPPNSSGFSPSCPPHFRSTPSGAYM